MKMYLLAGSLLITAASVYGITDYMKTKNKKEFKDLYKEAPVVEAKDVKLSDIKEEDYSRGKLESPAPPSPETKPAVATKPVKTKVKLKKKTSNYAVAETEETLVPVAAEVQTETPKPKIEFTAAPTAKKKLKKRISMKMYSRAAPVREVEVIEEKKQ